MRKMPIGMQIFEDIVTGGFAYVDKTAWVYELSKAGKFFFLGRPRRFGKSLLLSTLKAYFEGKRELFRSLEIEKLEKEWISYPVLDINLNVTSYKNTYDLEVGLNMNLCRLEEKHGQGPQGSLDTIDARFYRLIRKTAERSGKKVVVLIDEYDRPLVQTLENGGKHDELRDALKGFYGVLKSADEWLRFVFLTGVTKFSKVSVFSDLNMLRDISMNPQYAEICGISEKELVDTFKPELLALAENNKMTYDEAMAEMRKRYDGYHFCEDSVGMFNPFSVLNTLADMKFAHYWFKTGTPTFLIEILKQSNFDTIDFTDDIIISAESIDDYRVGDGNPASLLYQSGYLTIVGFANGRYTLGFPNEEVKYGFLKELLRYYAPQPQKHEFFADFFAEDLRKGDVDACMNRMRAFFANIPYELNTNIEKYYQLVTHLIFMLMGQYARTEVSSAASRADAIVETSDAVYIFEFKLDKSAEKALAQINDRAYALPFGADGRRIVKIGVNFDKDKRNISDWVVEQS